MTKSKLMILTAVAAGMVVTGCAKKKVKTNQELGDEFSGGKYSEDMVALDYENTEDQGASISPQAQAQIQDTIETVFVTDFEKCLEVEMERLENRWVAGPFAIEFTIETSGLVSSANVLSSEILERRTQDADGKFVSSGGKPPREATEFNGCVEEKALVPIIFITAFESERAREEALSAGARAFLRKPLDSNRLLDLIEGVLSGN